MVHACNPSYSEGIDQEDWGQRPTLEKKHNTLPEK
jgi:hypothetical protein